MKLDFKLATKDKRLLLTLLIIAIVVVAFIIFRKIDARIDEVNEEIKALEAVRDDYDEKNQHRSEYIVKSEIYDLMYSNIINTFASGLDEVSTIMDIMDIEDDTNAWIKQAGFGRTGVLYSFGQIPSSNPSSSGSGVYSTDLQGVSSAQSLSYECTYDELKMLIERINNTDKKYKIATMTVSYNQGEELVSGSMSLNYYAVAGSNRMWPGAYIPGVSQGTENIFASGTHTANPVDKSYLDTMKSDYDVYVALNSAASDVDSIVVALRNDVIGDTRASVNSNSKEKVQIHVSGSNGDYKISYQVGNTTYPATDYATGAPLLVGDTLDILVVSKARIDANDTCVAMLTVINDSDMTLNLGILNDDTENPRCVVEQQTGNVIVHR